MLGNRINDMCSKVSSHLKDISRFFSAISLILSPTIYTTTIYTNWTKEYRLHHKISVGDTKISTTNNNTLDSLLSIESQQNPKVASRQPLGNRENELLATYKTIDRQVINYVELVWYSGYSMKADEEATDLTEHWQNSVQ